MTALLFIVSAIPFYTAFHETAIVRYSAGSRSNPIEGYRRMPVWRKLKQVHELTALVCQLAMNDIRWRHPQADERELKLRLASRWIEPELMHKAFGWDQDKEGY